MMTRCRVAGRSEREAAGHADLEQLSVLVLAMINVQTAIRST
jgi:hypothetical protein